NASLRVHDGSRSREAETQKRWRSGRAITSQASSMLKHYSRSYGKNTAGALGNPQSSRMNANDRLSLDPLGRVEGGNRIVKGSHIADVSPQPTIPDPLDELTQLGAIGYNDEVDSQA